MSIYSTKSSFQQFFGFISIIFEMCYGVSFRANMIVPVETFSISVILRTISTFHAFWFTYSKTGIEVDKRRIYLFSCKVNHDTVFWNRNILSNSSYFSILNGKHSVFNGCLWIHVNPGIFKDGVIGVFCFNTIVLWEIILCICRANTQDYSQKQKF